MKFSQSLMILAATAFLFSCGHSFQTIQKNQINKDEVAQKINERNQK